MNFLFAPHCVERKLHAKEEKRMESFFSMFQFVAQQFNDNAYIERLWRTLKSEWFYIYGARQICEYKKLLIDFLAWYNNERPHQALKYQTPSKVLDYARLCENVENPEGFPTIPQLQQQIC